MPLEVGPDLFQPGPDQVAAVERDMRVLPAPDGQQFAFDVAGALEAVVALTERAGIDVGGVEAGGRQHVRVQRGAERQMAARVVLALLLSGLSLFALGR
jgi:hypothetical protein